MLIWKDFFIKNREVKEEKYYNWEIQRELKSMLFRVKGIATSM